MDSFGPKDELMAKAVYYWTLIEPVWLELNRSWDEGPDRAWSCAAANQTIRSRKSG